MIPMKLSTLVLLLALFLISDLARADSHEDDKQEHHDDKKKEDQPKKDKGTAKKDEAQWSDADIDAMFGGGADDTPKDPKNPNKTAADSSEEVEGPFGVFLPGNSWSDSDRTKATTMQPKPTESTTYTPEKPEESCIDSPHRSIDIWDRVLMLCSFPIVLSCVAMQTQMFR